MSTSEQKQYPTQALAEAQAALVEIQKVVRPFLEFLEAQGVQQISTGPDFVAEQLPDLFMAFRQVDMQQSRREWRQLHKREDTDPKVERGRLDLATGEFIADNNE